MLALTFCSNTVVIGGRGKRNGNVRLQSTDESSACVWWRRTVSCYYYCARVTRGNFFRRKTLEEPLKKGRIKVSGGITEIKNNKARAYCRYSRRLQLGALGRIIFFFCKNLHTRDFYRRFLIYIVRGKLPSCGNARRTKRFQKQNGGQNRRNGSETERKLNSTRDVIFLH